MVTPFKETATAPNVRANGHRSDRDPIRVLLVDDDESFREAARLGLEGLGFEVATMPDGEAMMRHLADGNGCDVIVLDWKLPRRSGIDCLRSLREGNVTVPVIILTSLAGTTYESVALDHGADDFIDKSRGLLIVAKRIYRAAAAGATATPSTPAVSSGKLMLQVGTSRAYWDGIDLSLTVAEFNIVHLMVSKADEHVTYRAIYDCVRHPGFVAGAGEDGYRTNVRSAIKRIRNKFRAIDVDFCQIENFPAFGYCWRSTPEAASPADHFRAPSRLSIGAEADHPSGDDHHVAGAAHEAIRSYGVRLGQNGSTG